MEIVFFEINKKEKAYIKKSLSGYKLKFFEEKIEEVPLKEYKNSEIISPFIYSKINSKILNQLKKLKAVCTRSTGFDHIDIKEAKKKKIHVGNVPFYGENTVAEHTFALMLNLSRKVHISYLRTKTNNFSHKDLVGFDLKGKTLGIIGVGHIGLHVIRIAKGFGLDVKAYDLNHDSFLSETLNFSYSNLDDLLKTSDIISLHMPLNKYTYHFLDKKKMSKMKKNVIIINTARGELIDTNELYTLLKKKLIGGVGLDVIEGEKYINCEEELLEDSNAKKKIYDLYRDEEIFRMENVIFTPHNAFNSIEAINRILDTTIENIKEFRNNKKVKYPVNIH